MSARPHLLKKSKKIEIHPRIAYEPGSDLDAPDMGCLLDNGSNSLAMLVPIEDPWYYSKRTILQHFYRSEPFNRRAILQSPT